MLRYRLLSSVSLAVVATTLAALDARLSPARAQICVTDVVSGNTTCSGNFTSNINNNANITLNPGVTVTSPGGNAVNSANTAQPPQLRLPALISL